MQILDATQGATSGVQPPLLRVAGSTVDLVAARADVIAMRSIDGGAAWGPKVAIGDRIYFTGAIGRDGTVVLGNGSEFTRTSLAGPLESRYVELNRGHGSFQAVGFAHGRPVYVSGGRAPTTAVRQWDGNGDIFDPATWTKRRRGPAMVYYDLDEGPRGLWLVHEPRTGGDDVVVVRRWRRGRFGPARTIPGSAGNVIGTAIAQDGRGRSPSRGTTAAATASASPPRARGAAGRARGRSGTSAGSR